MTRVSRRRFVAGTAMASACGRSGHTSAVVPARFVGQSPERGHRLRDGALLERPEGPTHNVGVLVVGGGAAGWAAMWRLAALGVTDALLVELEDAFGGTAAHGTLPRSAYPMGAHYLPTPPSDFPELAILLGDLGIRRSEFGTPRYAPTWVCPAPMERHFYNGRWFPGTYPSDGETDDEASQWARFNAELAKLDARRDAMGQRLFRLPADRSSAEVRPLAQQSMASWLDERGYSSWRLRWRVGYDLRDDYGCSLEGCSAFAGLHHYLCRGLEENREGLILTGATGNNALVDGMRRRSGGEARTGHMVYRIDPERGEAWVLDVARDTSYRVSCQAIIWAAPRFILERVVPPDADPAPSTIDYTPWLVAGVALQRAPAGVGAPLCWDNVAVHEEHLGYVVATHTEDREAAIQPGCVVSFYEPWVAGAPEALSQRRAELLRSPASTLGERVAAALERMHPGIRGDIANIELARWGHAMVAPRPGRLFSESWELARAPIGRVLPCGTDVTGLPLFEQAFASAITAAENAAVRLGRPDQALGGA